MCTSGFDMPRLTKRSRNKRNKTTRRKRRSLRNLRKIKGGERLQCGQVAYASTYRPLSFGEKVKLKFCKDKEPGVLKSFVPFNQK